MASQKDLTLYQGADYSLTLQLKQPDGTVIDLTGWSGKSQIRNRVGGTGEPAAEFNLDINATANTITLSLPYATTAALRAGKYEWDLFLQDASGRREKYLEGEVTIDARVTLWT
jgi:hypothetical protein